MQKVLLVCLDLTDYLGCREILAQLELLDLQAPLVSQALQDHKVLLELMEALGSLVRLEHLDPLGLLAKPE